MNSKKAKKLFKKYVKNECSAEELELLHRFLDSYQDKDQAFSSLDYNNEAEINRKIWLKIKAEIKVGKKKKQFVLHPYLKYAAIFLALLGVTYIYRTNFLIEPNNELVIKEESVILKLDNNENKKIDITGSEVLVDKNGKIIGTQNGTKLVYDKMSEIDKLVYNEVIVPNGKKFQLVLSDGTEVHLNSGTSFKYPAHFISDTDREVFLKGEAYFEVAKDENRPFEVHTSDLQVQVLGTHFNVNSYGNTETYAVLIEGSVAINKKDMIEKENSTILVPGQKASLTTDEIEINNVNVDDYISWRTGNLVFNNETFKDIIYKIERKYNVHIENRYTQLNTIKFKGKFGDESILDLLNTFKESAEFDYQIKDQKIIIMKP